MTDGRDDWWNVERDPVEDALSDGRNGHYGAGGRVLAAEIERLRTRLAAREALEEAARLVVYKDGPGHLAQLVKAVWALDDRPSSLLETPES